MQSMRTNLSGEAVRVCSRHYRPVVAPMTPSQPPSQTLRERVWQFYAACPSKDDPCGNRCACRLAFDLLAAALAAQEASRSLESRRLAAYRQVRIWEPNMDSY